MVITMEKFDTEYANIENKEELLLTHPAMDTKFILTHQHEIDFEKVSEIYSNMKKEKRLRQKAMDVRRVILRELAIDIDK